MNSDYDELRRLVWAWIIDTNNGAGTDTGDLSWDLNRNGHWVPEDMEDGS